MDRTSRPSGIPALGDVPWGSHICQFYRSPDDLLDLLVPYFKAGLENDEFCIWITSGPLSCAAAEAALRDVVRDFDARLASGQILIVPSETWYLVDGVFDGGRVVAAWIRKLREALANGYAGLRLSGNTFWLEAPQWHEFAAYEAEIDTVISRNKVLALCNYPLDRCAAAEVLDVVRNHTFALIRRDGAWNVIENQARRRAVDAARESRLHYESLFGNMIDAFAYHQVICDERGEPVDYLFLEVNEPFERLTGLKRENILGRRVTEVLPVLKDEPTGWIRRAGEVALSGVPIRFEQFSPEFGKWFLVSAYCPKRGYFAVAFEDITARKQSEAEIRSLNATLERQLQELEVANRELESFAYSVSHDLIAPLRSINGFCQVLLEDHGAQLADDGRDALARVQASSRHMAELIDALLQLSRLTRAGVKRTRVDVSAMAHAIADTLRRREPERQVAIDVQERIAANADPVMLRVALENLLANAWKFTARRGDARIELGCELKEGENVYYVRDNGVGFAMTDAGKLFAPFHRLHPPQEFPGLGIGLATVLRVVQRHGGHIWAEAAPGRGATFRFGLGAAAPEPAPENSAAEAAGERATRATLG